MVRYLLLVMVILLPLQTIGQYYTWKQQYFDGADTIPDKSILIRKDSTSTWQIGQPQKSIFDSAATLPNVLVTDTVDHYPHIDTLQFSFGINTDQLNPFSQNIPFALQWKQKLDIGPAVDLGTIQFSVDTGKTWNNPFKNVNVKNFYGFDDRNVDTLANGTIGFSGTDSTWKDIWLCFYGNWLSGSDTLEVRYRLLSDSIDFRNEGWIIDNMLLRRTFIHSIEEEKELQMVEVYPSPSNGELHIEIDQPNETITVKEVTILDSKGRLVQSLSSPTNKIILNIKDQPPGVYYVKIKRTDKIRTIPVILRN